MKKLTHILVALVVTFAAVLSLSACGKNPVTSATVSGLDLSVAKDSTLDTSNVIVTAKYKKGETKEFSGDDLSFGEFSTSELGTKELTITIDPEDYSFTVSIKVVASEADTNAITQLESELVKEYNANRTATSEYEDFVHDDITLRAGTLNPFHFRIHAAGIAADEETLLPTVSNVRTVVTVQEKTGSTYSALDATTLANYMTINDINAVIQFKDAANGKTFKFTVTAANPDEGYEAANYTFSADVEVVAGGFNVYDIVDMSVYDNVNVHGNLDRGDWIKDSDTGWTPYHNQVKARYGYANDFDLSSIETLILQDDIEITAENIRQDALWDEADASYNALKTLTDQTLIGTPHNSDNKGIFQRVIKTGENFSVIGNYFAVDISKLPKMVVYDEDDYVNYANDAAMTGYFSLFKTDPAADFQFTAEHDTSITYETMSFIGNGQMSADVRNSGSVLLMKHNEVNLYGYNTIANNFYTTYYFALGNPNNPNDGEYLVEDCKAFNSFTSAIYIWGGENITLMNSVFKNSGGPAILADTFSDEDGRADDYDEATETMFIYDTGDIAPTINIVNTVLEALASGQEPWYNEYNAGQAVGLMAMLGECLTGGRPFDYTDSPYTNTGNTVVADVMGGTTPRINVQCVLFGDGIISNRAALSGIINVYNSKAEYEARNTANHSLNLTNYICQDVVSQGAPVFECTATGSFRTAPFDGENFNPAGVIFNEYVINQFMNGLYSGLWDGLNTAGKIGTGSGQFNLPTPTGSMTNAETLTYINTTLSFLEVNADPNLREYGPDPATSAATAAAVAENFEDLVDGLYNGGAAKYAPVSNWAELGAIQDQVERVAAKATAIKAALTEAVDTCNDEWSGDHVNLYLPRDFGYMGILLGLYPTAA